MFFVKKGDSTKIVQAKTFDELFLKATTNFKLNPNMATLCFADPEHGNIDVDSQDAYEVIEQRKQELKATNPSYKPILTIEDGNAQAMQSFAVGNESMVSRMTVLEKAIKPVEGNNDDATPAGKIIFADRESLC